MAYEDQFAQPSPETPAHKHVEGELRVTIHDVEEYMLMRQELGLAKKPFQPHRKRPTPRRRT